MINGLSKNALYGVEVWGFKWQLGPVKNVHSVQMRVALTHAQTHTHYIMQYALIL